MIMVLAFVTPLEPISGLFAFRPGGQRQAALGRVFSRTGTVERCPPAHSRSWLAGTVPASANAFLPAGLGTRSA